MIRGNVGTLLVLSSTVKMYVKTSAETVNVMMKNSVQRDTLEVYAMIIKLEDVRRPVKNVNSGIQSEKMKHRRERGRDPVMNLPQGKNFED